MPTTEAFMGRGPHAAQAGRRVVQVCLGYRPETGGSALTAKHFWAALGGLVVNFSGVRGAPESANVITVPIGGSLLARKLNWVNGLELKRAAAQLEQADLIICHTLFRYHIQWASAIAFRKGIPFWVVLHGSLDPFVFTYRKLQKELWMSVFGNGILSSADAVICATERERQKAELRGLKMRTRVIPWPVEDKPDHPVGDRRAEIRQQLGIPVSDRVLLYLGRLHETKQPLETIRALRLSGVGNVHLIMVGNDETVTADQCRSLASTLHLPQVHVIGPVFDSRKWDYYDAADGYISLSLKENFGFTVAEALISAIPVILSPGIDLARDLARVGCGWVLGSATVEAAASAIKEFAVLSGNELCELGGRGRAWALANLSTEQFRGSLNHLLAESVAPRTAS